MRIINGRKLRPPRQPAFHRPRVSSHLALTATLDCGQLPSRIRSRAAKMIDRGVLASGGEARGVADFVAAIARLPLPVFHGNYLQAFVVTPGLANYIEDGVTAALTILRLKNHQYYSDQMGIDTARETARLRKTPVGQIFRPRFYHVGRDLAAYVLAHPWPHTLEIRAQCADTALAIQAGRVFSGIYHPDKGWEPTKPTNGATS